MRKLIYAFTVLICLGYNAAFSQVQKEATNERQLSHWKDYVTDRSLTYRQIVTKCDSLFGDYVKEKQQEFKEAINDKNKQASKGAEDESEEDYSESSQYNKYIRWRMMNGPRIDLKTGKPHSNLSRETPRSASKNMYWRQCSEGENEWSDWHFIGPQNFDVPRLGRVNCISTNPSNNQEIYVSDCWGGLWKTTNGGTDWVSLSDNYFNISGLGVNKFVVDYSTSPHRIFAAVGYITEWLHLDLAPSTHGFYYSYDDGQTFGMATYNNTSMNWDEDEYVSDMKIHPTNPNKVFITSKFKLMRANFNPATPTPGADIDVIIDYDLFGAYPIGQLKQRFNSFTSITFLPPTTGRPNPLVVSTRGQQDMHESSASLLRTNNCLTAVDYQDFEDITPNITTSAFDVNTELIENGDFSQTAGWTGFSSPDWVFGGGSVTSSHAGATPYTTGCLEQTIVGLMSPYNGIPMSLTGTVTIPNNAVLKIYLADLKNDPWSGLSVCDQSAITSITPVYQSDQDINVVYGNPYNFNVPLQTGGNYYNRIYMEVVYKSGYSGGTLTLEEISLIAPSALHIVTGSTPVAPGTLYSMVTMDDDISNGKTYVQRSTDYGNSWTAMGSIDNTLSFGWGSPDAEAMVVSTTDPDKIYYSGFYLHEFEDGETGIAQIAYSYSYSPVQSIPTHADVRSIFIRKVGNDEEVYVGHDGGLSTYYTATSNWVCNTCGTGSVATATESKFQSALTQGIGTDVYGGDIAVAAWDNGIMRTNRDSYTDWEHIEGGDGWRVKYSRRAALEHTVINMGNYGSWQAINVMIPSGLGINGPGITPISTPWFARTKTTDVGEYYGDFDVFRLEVNGGNASWNNISSGASGWVQPQSNPSIPAIAGDVYDPDVVAAFRCDNLWSGSTGIFQFTTNGGASWTSKTNPFNGFAAIDMVIDPRVNNGNRRMWAGMGHYSGTPGKDRVYQSTDNGNVWTDYSTGLPDGPVSALAYDHQAKILYAGTDIGVYFRKVDDVSHNWECFSKNLPNTIITDLELDRCQRKLYAATFGRGAWQTDLHPNYNWDDINDDLNTLVINNHTIWSADKQIDRNIFIMPGARLDIVNCTIHMARGKNIIIENTGKMTVTDATITNGCNCMWGDIVVKADENVPQSNNVAAPLSNSTSNQGLLTLENATLENALNAILVGNAQFTGFDYLLWAPGGDGGVVMAENSTFRNCDRAVCFNVYNHLQNSFFNNCNFVADEFLKDDQYVNTALGTPRRYGTESFATSWLSDGVKLENCTFITDLSPDFNPDPDLRGVGWGQYAASTKIENCTFENLTRGTYFADMYSTTSSNSVINSTYTNVWRGATFLGVNNVVFTNNNMTVGEALPADGWGHTDDEDPNLEMSLDPYGLYYSQGQIFAIRDNVIDEAPGTNFSYGIIMNNVYDPATPTWSIYSLYRNTMYNDVGITANQDNRGLQIKCNNLYDDKYGILVSSMMTHQGSLPQNGRLSDQGNCNSGNGPVDNEFNYSLYPPCLTNAEHIASIHQNPDNDFIYYHHLGAPYEAVCYTAGHPVFSLITRPYDCLTPCNGGVCCPDPPPISTGPDPEEKSAVPMNMRMLQSINTLENSVAKLQQDIERGDSKSLNEMLDDPGTNVSDIQAALSEVGPYLSDEVLKKLIQRSPTLPYGYLKETLIANSGLRKPVWNALEDTYPDLARDEEIVAAQNAPSTRTVLEGALTDLHLSANQEKMNLLGYYKRKQQWEAAGELLEQTKGYLLAFPYYLKAGNMQKALEMIEQMPDEDAKKLCLLQLDRLKMGKSLQEPLTKTEEAILTQISKSYESRAGESARNWLRLANGNTFMEPMPILPIGNGGSTQPKTRQWLDNTPSIKIYPNPVSDKVNIALENGQWQDGSMISVYDIMGRRVTTLLPDGNNSIISLNTSTWNAGHYVVVVTHPGKKTESHKLTIEK